MLDIFRKQPRGGALWIGTAKDEEEARRMVTRFHAANPGEYFTFEQGTRTKHTIKLEELGDVQP